MGYAFGNVIESAAQMGNHLEVGGVDTTAFARLKHVRDPEVTLHYTHERRGTKHRLRQGSKYGRVLSAASPPVVSTAQPFSFFPICDAEQPKNNT